MEKAKENIFHQLVSARAATHTHYPRESASAGRTHEARAVVSSARNSGQKMFVSKNERKKLVMNAFEQLKVENALLADDKIKLQDQVELLKTLLDSQIRISSMFMNFFGDSFAEIESMGVVDLGQLKKVKKMKSD